MIPEADLARQLKVSKRVLWVWRKKGCPYIKPSGNRGKVFYDLKKVLEWAEEQTLKELRESNGEKAHLVGK